MNAKELVESVGESLVGATVFTKKIGEYPGGPAKVIELNPDPAAPEIVMQVKHPTFGEIGIFEDEPIIHLQ